MSINFPKIMNTLTFVSVLAAGNSAYAQGNIERLIAIQQAEITKIKNQLEPVGTLVSSLLTEPQFVGLKGPGWVLCDGRAVTGTRYAAITGRGFVPDCRGRFLRSTGGPAGALGTPQSFATSVKDIFVPQVSTTTVAGHADIRLFTESPSLPNAGSWVIDQSKHGSFLKGGGTASTNLGAGYQTGWRDQGHTHSVTIPATSLTGGANETRPDNIAVNIFVRVD